MNNSGICQSDKCSIELLERPRYFPRQLISDAELNLEQSYFRNRLRLHNRMLHGWGVVCGAMVCRVPGDPSETNTNCDNGGKSCDGYKPWKVVIQRGYVLGPCGDEIVIGCEHEVDLRSYGATGVSGESTAHVVDPWCCEGTVKRGPGCYWVAIKYKECKTRPVRVQPIGCGCDDTQCEYSRLRDGYEIGILDECPDTHKCDPDGPEIPHLPEFKEFHGGHVPCCPPCPEDPWVVLAKVCIDEHGCVESIDNCSCRRLVFSFSRLWWQCCVAPPEIEKVSCDKELMPGDDSVEMTIEGGSFPCNAKLAFESGVRITKLCVYPPSKIVATMSVLAHATPGQYTLRVIDPCGCTADCTYTIIPKKKLVQRKPASPKARGKRGAGRKTPST